MTLLSTLVGGGSAASYRAGNLYPALPRAIQTTASAADNDHIVPWLPRATMTLDKVAWYRDIATAANVYVGLYDSAGTLLTDCAVDIDTTTGWHLVDTTNVTLVAGSFYWLAWNASADVAGTQAFISNTSYAAIDPTYDVLAELAGLAVGIGTADATISGVAQKKSRINAALLSSLTMSGWALDAAPPALGVVPA